MKEINDLKAKAYDLISQIEFLQNELQKTNVEISKKVSEFNEANNKLNNITNE